MTEQDRDIPMRQWQLNSALSDAFNRGRGQGALIVIAGGVVSLLVSLGIAKDAPTTPPCTMTDAFKQQIQAIKPGTPASYGPDAQGNCVVREAPSPAAPK